MVYTVNVLIKVHLQTYKIITMNNKKVEYKDFLDNINGTVYDAIEYAKEQLEKEGGKVTKESLHERAEISATEDVSGMYPYYSQTDCIYAERYIETEYVDEGMWRHGIEEDNTSIEDVVARYVWYGIDSMLRDKLQEKIGEMFPEEE